MTDTSPDLLRSAQTRLSADDADRYLLELARELGCDVGSVGVPDWPMLLERVRDLRAATQPESDPEPGETQPEPAEGPVEDMRTDLLRALAGLEIMRGIAVVFREGGRGRDQADELDQARETMRDPERFAERIADALANPVRVRWLLRGLAELRPKRRDP